MQQQQYLKTTRFYIFLVNYIVIKYTHIIICASTDHCMHLYSPAHLAPYSTLHFFRYFSFLNTYHYIHIVWSRMKTAKREDQIVQQHHEMYCLRYYLFLLWLYILIFLKNFDIIIIIKCMCSRCRRDDIHVCFAYASPQRMSHMYDHKIVSL